jgi:carbon starvation protein
MNGAVLVAGGMVYFVAAYFLYGKFIAKYFGVDPSRPTPANELKDGVDYVPAKSPVLFGHHFASIAGAGPIVGPVAAAYFGWLPALLWILIGCVFIGAFHDFAALFLSVRDKGRSIGHVIEGLMGYAGRQVFLIFAWAALVLVVAIFGLLVAKTFATTPAVATASLLFIGMAPIFGWLVYRKNVSILKGSIVFVPLLFVFVWVGTLLPIDLAAYLQKGIRNANMTTSAAAMKQGLAGVVAELDKTEAGMARLEEPDSPAAKQYKSAEKDVTSTIAALAKAHERMSADEMADTVLAPLQILAVAADAKDPAVAKELSQSFVDGVAKYHATERAKAIWIWVLLAYVFVASVVPVWILLQPRDYLNSYLLYAMILVGFLGILVFAPGIKLPAFAGWVAKNSSGKEGMLFPLLFVTIACGACSGFHSLVSSGTTAKQLASEKHILPVGYGGMLVEGVLAIMALVSVGYLAPGAYNATLGAKGPVGAFASGLATFADNGIGLPFAIGKTFVALAISAFMLTTLDTATRLARFTWQEMFLPRSPAQGGEDKPRKLPFLSNPVSATVISVGVAGGLAFSGGGMAIWKVFGASNQLLAALTLLAVTLYLLKRKKKIWLALLPMVFMMVITIWALVLLVQANWGKSMALALTSIFLLVMALALVVLALGSVRKARSC